MPDDDQELSLALKSRSHRNPEFDWLIKLAVKHGIPVAIALREFEEGVTNQGECKKCKCAPTIKK